MKETERCRGRNAEVKKVIGNQPSKGQEENQKNKEHWLQQTLLVEN